MDEKLYAVMTRRSIRKYTDKRISDEDMETLLKAGMYAPSARNGQPWEFIVVRDRDKLTELAEYGPYWKMLPDAAAAIVVLGAPERLGDRGEYIQQDLGACTENILVAAWAMGIGSVWLGCYPNDERVSAVKASLGIPGSVFPFCLIALGYPAEERHCHTSFDKDRVHLERY